MKRDHAEVGALSGGVTFEPLSIPLQDSLRFFRAPLPAHSHSFSCDPPTHAILWVELRAYPVPSEWHEWVRPCLFAGGLVSAYSEPLAEYLATHLLVQARQQLGPVYNHGV